MPCSKDSLRKLALRARAALGKQERTAKSLCIAQWLQGWDPYRNGRHICLYASFGSEVQTARLAAQTGEASPEENSAKRFLYLPRVEGEELVIHRFEPPATAKNDWSIFPGLVRSPMGMLEPLATLPAVLPQMLDVILVPGSAFCVQSGQRLGYGKGFYDRLLTSSPQALKVGLGFDVQMFDSASFPSEPHDIALDVLVSESGIRDLR